MESLHHLVGPSFPRPFTRRALKCATHGNQVKVAEHVLTGHKVAIKILNRRKIKQMDMEEKGAHRYCFEL